MQTELPVLDHPGFVSHQEAQEWSQDEYERFDKRRRLETESDAEIQYIEDLKKTAKEVEKGRDQVKKSKPAKKTTK